MKFKMISAKLVGSNVVNFRLEDGTLMKIHVEIGRMGVAVDAKAPDGSPIYNFNLNPRIEFVPKDRTYLAPAPNMPITKTAVASKKPDYTS
jgi:hypothetical protein